jgi:uncharacterized protein with gpF-like domain
MNSQQGDSDMIDVKKEHFSLDRAHLEEAILNQASLYDLYASECARQQNKVDRLKNGLEYAEAQKKIDIRRNAEDTGKKMTQDQVDCEVVVDSEIVAIKQDLLDAEEYLAQLKVAVAAMVHKRDSIENEVRMVMSKVSMTNGDVSSETRYDAQVEAVDRATQASMLGR